MIWHLVAALAQATTGFNPSTPAARLTDTETWDLSGEVKIWSAIERLEDTDRTLFESEDFNTLTEWPANNAFSPWVRESFGSARPASWNALLHMGPAEEVAVGTPILFIPGAGDNASRGFVTMATRMDRGWRPVYALTFAHPHGDMFQHAEQIANAIARIKARTGAAQVDLVAHSKGGVEAAIYLANAAGSNWDNSAYESVGTTYRGDVRRAVFIAAPLDGIDTAYRWPASNLASLDAETAMAPTSWDAYYPWGTANLLVVDDLSNQDFLTGDVDLFPGHRQLLRRQDHPLPGSMPWLGSYAAQPDWYTTYEGGVGFTSTSQGIDAAIADGGNLLDKLEAQGIDPDIEIYLLAGDNPMMPSAAGDFAAETYGEAYADMVGATSTAWADLISNAAGDGLDDSGITTEEIQGLAAGKLILGDITGPSDGLVFTTSSTYGDALTARGATVKETKVVSLSHMDLLYASPITGQLLVDAADEAPENAYMRPYGERYIEADTLGWVETVLADPESPDPSDDDEPGDDPADPDDDFGGDVGLQQGCEGCSSSGGSGAAFPIILGLLALRRKRD